MSLVRRVGNHRIVLFGAAAVLCQATRRAERSLSSLSPCLLSSWARPRFGARGRWLVQAVAAAASPPFYIPAECADNILPRAPIHTSFHPLGLDGHARRAAIGWPPCELLITMGAASQWAAAAAADVNVIHQSESGIYFVQRICSCRGLDVTGLRRDDIRVMETKLSAERLPRRG